MTDRINILQKNYNPQSNPNKALHEEKIIRKIQSKLRNNNATITRADKGNSTVILPREQYNNKLQEFIQNNKFDTAHTDPTKTFQSQVRNTINSSKVLIPKETRWKYTNMNPSAPTIKGLIKVQKAGQPIRPFVNCEKCPCLQASKIILTKNETVRPLTQHTQHREH